MSNILAVGIATLDMIFEVNHYPGEDTEGRAQSLRVVRGGNATNTLAVLSRMGHRCAWAGVMGDAPETSVIVNDLSRHAVDTKWVRTVSGRPPTSSIMLSRSSGSRTIVHYRDLPEFSFDDFRRIPLAHYDWVHFEGRNIPELEQMMRLARREHPGVKLSVEAEKPRDGLERVLHHADLVLASKAWAGALGYAEPEPFLTWLRSLSAAPQIAVAWGDAGAYGVDSHGQIAHSPAFPPKTVVDTVGAGDTFNAGMIDAALRTCSMNDMLEAACRLAGRKCGVAGFDL